MRKLTFLMIAGLLLLLTSIGVFAWFVIKPLEYSIMLQSENLMETKMTVTIKDEMVVYNNEKNYDENHYAVIINSKEELESLKVDFTVSAFTNLYVKVKVVTEWFINDKVIHSNSNINYDIANPIYETKTNETETPLKINEIENIDQYGNHYYKDMVNKNTSMAFPFITKATLDNENAFNNGAKLRFSLIVSGIQANRKEAWGTVNAKELSFSEDQIIDVKVKFKGISTPYDAVVINFCNKADLKNTQYIWTDKIKNKRIELTNGTYHLHLEIPNFLDFTYQIENNILSLTISYTKNVTEENWAQEHIVYSPSIVNLWDSETQYKSKDIVYYEDDKGKITYWKALTDSRGANPTTTSWAWASMERKWQSNIVYDVGTIVYYKDAFWQSEQKNASEPGKSHQWTRLDKTWSIYNQENRYYKKGDYIIKGKELYVLTADNYGGNPEDEWSNWFHVTTQWKQARYAKYDIVEHNGNLWISIKDDNRVNIDEQSGNGWRKLDNNFEFVQFNTYKEFDIVKYENQYYIASNNVWGEPSILDYKGFIYLNLNQANVYDINTNYQKFQVVSYEVNQTKKYFVSLEDSNQTEPTQSYKWKEITSEYSPYTQYKEFDFVNYNNLTYVWVYDTPSSKNDIPGVSYGWKVATQTWNPINNYRNNLEQTIFSYIYEDNKWWVWTGKDNTRSTLRPGIIGSNWQELTEYWRIYNEYKKGDKVIFDGSFWEALEDPGKVGPGNDFTIWKEYKIEWNPNRP
ncbi:conserved hypothetical protein [Alteracholeplasma palmae J233]|uniref:Uncharacterized protein n=1 Tax=Alteracholeplasma palmae (strain ATCC 49389 / J233) TaxID=1318466 RepID=U4KKI0_ALTPJ|nr:hypothetical protein [Alteracholeplasma palmae]CCV64122.1 conserved hypothetical protein [Alteracholeplasma palmae J233]